MRIGIVVRSLERGGAERQAAATAAELARRGHEVDLLTFHGGDAYRDVLGTDVAVAVLADGGRWRSPLAFARWVRRARADAVLAYVAGPNLVSLLAHLARPRPRIIWGIRTGEARAEDATRLGRLVARLEPLLSRGADLAVANSCDGRRVALERGFRAPVIVVPNGFDVDRWMPMPSERVSARLRLGVDDDRSVVVRVARIHPCKGHEVLLEAHARVVASLASEGRPRPVLVVAGRGDRSRLEALAARLGIAEDVRWLDEVDDLRPIYAAADLAVSSSSYAEAFPNVIGEAMASGVPSVGTDLGETGRMIGDRSRVVPPGDVGALADAMERLVRMDRAERVALGARDRRRIVEELSVVALGDRVEELLEELLGGGA